jgi:hypothetical protein
LTSNDYLICHPYSYAREGWVLEALALVVPYITITLVGYGTTWIVVLTKYLVDWSIKNLYYDE